MNELKTLLLLLIKLELKDLEKFLSPFLFSALILIILNFSFHPEGLEKEFFIAQWSISLFLSSQILILRLFDFENKDGIYTQFRLSLKSFSAWFSAKVLILFLLLFLNALTCLFWGVLLSGASWNEIAWVEWSTIMFLSIAGLSILGVLLAALLNQAQTTLSLLPILFYPMSIPLLLGTIEGLSSAMKTGNVENIDVTMDWISLLTAFDVIYLTLGYLIFYEITRGESR